MAETTVAALQLGTDPMGTAATLATLQGYGEAVRAAGIDLLVLPEALLGGYPKGEGFGTQLGYRLPEGRARFADYAAQAIDVPGPETDGVAGFAAGCGCDLVIGVVERDGATLYCTALLFTAADGLVAKHRKLMPTGTERLVWGQGDGSTMPVVPTRAGRVGMAICWENHMPLFRTAMYGRGLDLWCAPTVDDRDVWQCSMRHIAHEGRCFVVSACQVMPAPGRLGRAAPGWPEDRPLIRGGSVIVGPLGDVLAGPLFGEPGLVTARIDTASLAGARYDFDPVGHYNRADVFQLTVDDRPRSTVRYAGDREPTDAADGDDARWPNSSTPPRSSGTG